MSFDLPNEHQFLCDSILRKHRAEGSKANPEHGGNASGATVVVNHNHGNHIKDELNYRGKDRADPTAGSGDGGMRGWQKPEII